MHVKIAVVLLAAMMFASVAVVFSDNDSSDAADTYTVVGYIADSAGDPIASKTVVISEGDTIVGQNTSDTNGKFIVEITPTAASALNALLLRVVNTGTAGGSDEVDYIINDAPDCMSDGGDENEWDLDLTAATVSGTTYTISSSISDAVFLTSDTDPVYTVVGFVATDNGAAIASKTVVISTAYVDLGKAATNSGGKFSIEIQTSGVSDLFIRIVYEGTAGLEDEVDYKIVGTPAGIEPLSVTGDDRTKWALDLTGFDLDAGTYTISDSLNHAIFVTSGKAVVGFHIIGKEGKSLYDAKVSLYDGNKIVANASTDYYGTCEFSSQVPYDTYKLVVKCNGYQEYEGNLVVNDSQIYTEIQLTEKQAPTFYGMTTYHFLMLIGIVLGLTLVVISYILVIRNWKGMEEG